MLSQDTIVPRSNSTMQRKQYETSSHCSNKILIVSRVQSKGIELYYIVHFQSRYYLAITRIARSLWPLIAQDSVVVQGPVECILTMIMKNTNIPRLIVPCGKLLNKVSMIYAYSLRKRAWFQSHLILVTGEG
jgi:hypothetical protein